MSDQVQSSDMVTKGLWGSLGTVVGVLITFVTAVSTHSEDIARLTERIDNLVDIVESGTSDRYRGVDAARDFRLRDQRIDHNAREIEELKKLHERTGSSVQ